jgi:hypothetical protein
MTMRGSYVEPETSPSLAAGFWRNGERFRLWAPPDSGVVLRVGGIVGEFYA